MFDSCPLHLLSVCSVPPMYCLLHILHVSKYTTFFYLHVKLPLMGKVSCCLTIVFPCCMWSHVLHLGFPHGVEPLGCWVFSRDPFINIS